MRAVKSDTPGREISTKEALYRAVLANPRDDLPRKVFADHCYEIGEPQRGEFILTQLELERARNAGWQEDLKAGLLTSSDPAAEHRERMMTLEKTARRLLLNPAEKSGAVGTNFTHWAGSALRLTTGPHERGGNFLVFERGFVGRLSVSLYSWMGGPCGCLFGPYRRPCRVCRDDVSWVSGLGPQLVARHPIEALRINSAYFTPCNDYQSVGAYHWSQETRTENVVRGHWWAIPACLDLPWGTHPSGVRASFVSESAARAAVDSAALSWARRMAEQPDLLREQTRERAALYGVNLYP